MAKQMTPQQLTDANKLRHAVATFIDLLGHASEEVRRDALEYAEGVIYDRRAHGDERRLFKAVAQLIRSDRYHRAKR